MGDKFNLATFCQSWVGITEKPSAGGFWVDSRLEMKLMTDGGGLVGRNCSQMLVAYVSLGEIYLGLLSGKGKIPGFCVEGVFWLLLAYG